MSLFNEYISLYIHIHTQIDHYTYVHVCICIVRPQVFEYNDPVDGSVSKNQGSSLLKFLHV